MEKFYKKCETILMATVLLGVIMLFGVFGYAATVLDPDYGGTGFDTYTAGDILYSDATDSLAKLPISTNDKVLTLAAGLPSWEDPTGVSDHGGLAGLADDDHTQYILVDGTRAFTGDANLADDLKLNFDTADTKYLEYSTDHGEIVLNDYLAGIAKIGMAANTGAAGGGSWEPFFDLNIAGDARLQNQSQGDAGDRLFVVSFTDGLNLITTPSFGAKFKADNITGSHKTFEVPNSSGTLALAEGNVYSGVHDFGGVTSIEIANAAAPTTDATGEIALDTTIVDHQPLLQYFDGGENMTIPAFDTSELPALDNEIIKYDAATDKFVLEADAGAGGGSTTFPLYPYSAKITGSYVTATIANLDVATKGCDIEAGEGAWSCLFDDTSDWAGIWYGILPTNYSSVPVCNLIYSMTSSTTNQVEWECAIQCTTPGDAQDINTEAFAAGASAVVTVPGTAGHTGALVSITPTDDSCAAGDLIYFYYSTDANDAINDDATGNRELKALYGSFTQ